MYDLAIRNGTVVTAEGAVRADVGIEGETIAAVGLNLAAEREIDAHGCYVIPGAVDPHVHLQMRLGGRVTTDDFATGSVAALCGGTTTVIDFVDPQPEESLLDALTARKGEADGQVACDYGLHMTIPAWQAASAAALGEIAQVVAAGCATCKLYMAYPNVMLDDAALLRVMQTAAEAGGGVVLHAETGPVLDVLRAQALTHGHTQAVWHARTRPARLEASAVVRAMALAEQARCPLYVFHVGASAVVDVLQAEGSRFADGRFGRVWAETCPHYLLLSAEAHLRGPQGELCICAPPLRGEADQLDLWAALASGAVQVVSTDHCPWTRAEKQQADFSRVPGGVPGIEARLALIYQHGAAAGRIALETWVAVCCTNPARWMGLARKGWIAPGFDADVVIFDPQWVRRLSVETLHEAADWTPYEGMEIQGWPRTVLLRGEPVVVDGVYTAARRGRFVARVF